jgi:hypothetical protein
MKTIPSPGASRQLPHPSNEHQPSQIPNLKTRVGKPKRKQLRGRRKSTVVVSKSGPGCPRCHRPTQVRTHAKIGPKQLRQPYYFEKWFRCTHRDCITTQIMDPQYIHWNDNERARKLQMRMNRSRQSYGR